MKRSTADAAREATARLKGTWHGSYGMACCPAHQDRTPSLSIKPGHSAVLYKCFAGCTQDEIIAALAAEGVAPTDRKLVAALVPTADPDRHMRLALDIWDRSRPIRGTLAHRYLKSRGLADAGPARFDPASKTVEIDAQGERRCHTFPALVLPMRNTRGFRAIQRIFLSPSGGKAAIDAPKKILGKRHGASIRIGTQPPGTINLAEGFEDAMSAMALKQLPGCWAVCGKENYRHIDLPEDCRKVVIYSQHGADTQQAIEAAREHLTANGRTLSVILPPPGGDWNDELMRRGGMDGHGVAA